MRRNTKSGRDAPRQAFAQTGKERSLHSLDSYNRVRTLVSKKIFWLLLVACLGSIAVGVVELTPWAPELGSLSVGSLSVPWLSIGALVSLSFFRSVYRRSKKACRFCGRPLQAVARRLVLKNELLSRPGLVVDGSFYSLIGRVPSKRKWMRLQQKSRACHHCRLYEAGHFNTYEPLTRVEENKLHALLDKAT